MNFKDICIPFFRSKLKYLLLVIPLFYLFAGFYMNYLSGIYFLRSVDSEYIYFVSGLSLAQGKLMIGHIDNPATPLQYLVALVFRLVYLFRSPDTTIVQDAIENSELYLKIANLAYITLISTAIYLAGRSVYRHSGKLHYAILLQTTPFITELTIDNLSRFAPETFLLIPTLLITTLIIKLIEDETQLSPQETALYSGLIIGFGLSIKLTFLPMGLLPLFFIRKAYLRYFLTTTITFLVIALPVTLQIDQFYFWVKKLIFHSGQHGSGTAGLIDANTFFTNLKWIFEANKLFFDFLFVFVAISIYTFFSKNRNKNLIRLSLGLLLILGLTLFMVGRQFEYRYFILALYLFPLLIIIAVENVQSSVRFSLKKYGSPVIVLTISGLVFFYQLHKLPSKTKQIQTAVATETETYNYVQSIPPDAVKVIACDYYGNPFKEYAMMFTGAYAGVKPNKIYKPFLAKMYPNSYLYHTWDRTFHQWGNDLMIDANNNQFYLYLPYSKLLDQIKKDLAPHIAEGITFQEKLIFRNTKNDNCIFLVNTSKVNEGTQPENP